MLCQPFGCKACIHIAKEVRRKNQKGRADLAIVDCFEENTVPGYPVISFIDLSIETSSPWLTASLWSLLAEVILILLLSPKASN